jgi:hypothetical protein
LLPGLKNGDFQGDNKSVLRQGLKNGIEGRDGEPGFPEIRNTRKAGACFENVYKCRQVMVLTCGI